jgi:hypothetical protein
METYDEHAFHARIAAALERIRTVLDNTRHPQYPADVPHRYDDKYLLAELVTRAAIASWLASLEAIGMTEAQLAQLRGWAKTRSVTIRLTAHEECRFLREETRKVEAPNSFVTETRGLLGGKTTRTEKMVTTVIDYIWGFQFEYELVAFQGTAVDQGIALCARSGTIEIKTAQKATPRPASVVRSPVDLNVTWALAHLDAEGRAAFAIDRTHADCHTPRRNDDVDAALAAMEEIFAWAGALVGYFRNELFPAQQEHGLDLAAIDDRDVFVPVLPLFEENAREPERVLPVEHLPAFLAEEERSLAEKRRALSAAFPRDATVITAVEAALLVTLLHARTVCQRYSDSVDYIEDMLRQQLIAAIGKELTPADFTAYMEFHHRKLVKPEFRPLPFSYAIRRPEHDPEGVLTIEAGRGTAEAAISTTVRHTEAQRPMSFAIDASSRVSFGGDRHLHAWISHQFSGQPSPALTLHARARQFSSFIVLVGRISSSDTFEPRLGVIVQNKDLVKIPLLLEQIPTPKEFRDAIESLSPEQQRFAKAFRGMQLESTLFGVCVIQIKPQLERLLKLPPDSLTKEIRMTQDLLNLFIEHQIPSDLLSYDGPADAPSEAKLERVKEYVGRMHDVIELSKQRELEEERAREAMRLAEQNRSMPQYPMGAPPMAGGAPGGFGGAPFGGPPPMPAMSAPAPRSATVAAPPQAPTAVAASPPAELGRAAAASQSAAQPTRAAQPTSAAVGPAGDGEVADYTRLPGQLDRKLEQLDVDGALRATIINPGDPWMRTRQKGLLGATMTTALGAPDQRTEKQRAFDLLDALTKSGALSIDDASLHVVLAATHCFDRTLLDTVIQDNVNPIEKVERSLMIVGTTIHGRSATALLADDQRDRFFATSPQLGDASAPALPGGEPAV